MIVEGGTLTDMQPTISAQRQVYKLMREMGIVIGYEVRKHGQFPSVIGTVAAKVQKLTGTIKPIDLGVDRGNGGEKKTHIKVFVTEGQKEFFSNIFEQIQTEL